jgi:DNA-binding beta-propeller fold protein YncE
VSLVLLAGLLPACAATPAPLEPSAGASATAQPAATDAPAPASPTAPPPALTLLVTSSAARHVAFVDPESGAVQQVEVGAAPWGLALAPGDRAYVATAEGVAVVDTAARQRLALMPYRAKVGAPGFGEYRPGGMGIAVAPDGRRVYVGVYLPDGSAQLEIVDAEQGAVIEAVPIGARPFQVLASRDGRAVYTIDHDTFTVTVVDTATLATRTFEAAPLGRSAFDKPHYAALRADGHLLLPFQGRTLLDLDPSSGATTQRELTASTHQHGVALTPDGRRLLIVGTGPAGGVSGSAGLSIVDLETGAEQHIPLARPHENVAASPDGRYAFLTGGYTFADGGWDGLTIVDLDKLTLRELPIPDRPLDIAILPARP